MVIENLHEFLPESRAFGLPFFNLFEGQRFERGITLQPIKNSQSFDECCHLLGNITHQRTLSFWQVPEILSNNGHFVVSLDSLNVLGLPALGAFGDVELHGLAFLQAAKAASLNSREMHKNVLAILTADEAVAFGIVEPLDGSLFHIDVPVFT